jgi:5-methylcytosine-specific restriction protein A
MMPTAIKRHLPALLKPRYKTLAERNAHRTLALNGATWRKLRAIVLREQPMCPVCEAEGKLVPAVDVDHIDNDASNNARDNLMGLCRPHHSVKTNVDHYGRRVRGCDAERDAARPGPRLARRKIASNRQPRTDLFQSRTPPHL